MITKCDSNYSVCKNDTEIAKFLDNFRIDLRYVEQQINIDSNNNLSPSLPFVRRFTVIDELTLKVDRVKLSKNYLKINNQHRTRSFYNLLESIFSSDEEIKTKTIENRWLTPSDKQITKEYYIEKTRERNMCTPSE